jgi:hypothetical protein
VDDVMLTMLREARGEIRDDIAGQRIFFSGQIVQRAFTQTCGLVIAALARSRPGQLLEEFGDLANIEPQQAYYFGWYERSPVTMELAIFMARQGRTGLVDRVISEIETSMRWGNQAQFARRHVQIAALEMMALGEHRAALDRVNDNIANLAADGVGAGQAHYLRARILVQLGEHGSALRALEDSMEASTYAKVLLLVDDAFEPLRGDRRFQTVLRYCELAARRLDASQRPWRPEGDTAVK